MDERPTFGNLVQRIKNESFYFYIGESNLVQKIKMIHFPFIGERTITKGTIHT